jgi:hypothetical protein
MGVDNISQIKNKIKRKELFRDAKIEKSKKKLAERKERARAEKLNPKLKEVKHTKTFSRANAGTTKDEYPRNTRK